MTEACAAGLHARRRRRGVRPGRRGRPGSTASCPTIAGYAVSPQARGADLLVQPLPNDDRRRCRSATTSTSTKKFPDGDRRRTASSPATSPPPRSSASQDDEAVEDARLEEGLRRRRTRATGASDWTPYAQKMQGQGRQGPDLGRRAGEPGQAAPGAERHRLHSSTSSAPTPTTTTRSSSTSAARRSRTSTSAARSPRSRTPRRGPGHAAVPRRVREVPARTARPKALPRPAGVVGVAALRHRRERVRQRPHPQVRVRQRQEDHGLDRRRPARRVRPRRPARRRDCFTELIARPRRRVQDRRATSKPNDGIYRCDSGNVVHAHGRLPAGRHARRRRQDDGRPQVAVRTGSGARSRAPDRPPRRGRETRGQVPDLHDRRSERSRRSTP